MNPDDHTCHIAIAFDHHYLQPFYALITSLFVNNEKHSIHLHTIASGISIFEKQNIELFVKEKHSQITFYTIDEQLVNRFVLVNKWTPVVYYRLFFPLLVPANVSRLLYVDTDTVIVGDIRVLFSEDLIGFPLGAVYDNYVKTQPLIGVDKEGEYFNSGVLLMDLKRWKEQNITQKAVEYLHQYPERILFVDQCALNAVLKKNWKALPEKYNLIFSYIPEGLSRYDIQTFLLDKVIIHYTLHRPWSMLCKNRLAFLYHRYLKQSPMGRQAKWCTDFSWKKIPDFLRIQLLNLYFDLPLIPFLWRKLKQKTST
jgi:lipopolysaccharide biosynthesis glycosyltransferase